MGDAKILEYLTTHCSARQCAAAVMAYLKDLKKPLLTSRIQKLILG